MKISKPSSILLAASFASLLGLAAAGAQAQDKPHAPGHAGMADKSVMSSKSLSDDDRQFMIKAAANGLFEIEVSKMAAKKAGSAEVKRYAAMMVKDHTAASEELTTIAVSKPLRLPRDMADGKKAELKLFAKASPAEFDKKYVEMVGLEDHRADIKLFEEQIERGKDPEVKAYATKVLAKMRMHLAAAEKLASSGTTSAAAK